MYFVCEFMLFTKLLLKKKKWDVMVTDTVIMKNA